MTTRSTHSSSERRDRSAYLLREPAKPRVPVRFLVAALVFGVAIGALVALAMRLTPLLPLSLSGGVVALGFAAVHVRRELRSFTRDAEKVPQLVLDDGALVLVEDEERTTTILPLERRFGLTLLASPARRDLVLAITHRDGVEYLAGRAPSGTRHVELLARAVSIPQGELPIGDRVPIFQHGDRLLELAADLEARAPGAFDRVFLSDAGMADVVLDGRKLRAGQVDFDLRVPLSWRAYSFQEGTTFASHSFQATQIRQGEHEIVLVALAPTGEIATPSIVSPPPGTTREGPLAADAVQRALARDLRLAQGLADMPPPRMQRVAIDRLFMPRLRQALDEAPTELVVVPRTSADPPLTTPIEGVEKLRQSSPNVR